MKTKYVKVMVSERLPEKGGTVLTDLGDVFFRKDTKNFEDNYGYDIKSPEYWYQQVPDHSEEMLEMLEDLIGYEDRCRAKGNPMIGQGWYNKAKKLINKVKDNG